MKARTILKGRYLLLLVVVLFAILSDAQAITIGLPASGGNCFPFGCSYYANPTRYQQVYASSEFSGSISIMAIQFFKYSGSNLNSGTYVLSLSTTSKAVNGLNLSNFDDNLGPDNQLFTTQVLTGGFAPAVLTFSGNTFHYDPTMGNLLLDIKISGFVKSTSSSFFQARNGNAGGVFSRAHDFDGGFNDYGLVTEFVPIPEPSTLLLVGSGLLGFGILGRVRLSRKKLSKK